jgi:integrase
MCRTHGKPPDRKHPFLDRHYVAAVQGMPETTAGARDAAILALGLVSALRRSNLAALTIHDLRLDPEGFVVRVARSKTDQEARGDFVVVPATFTPTCPVQRIRRWLERAKLLDARGEPDRTLPKGTPIFYPVDRKDRVVRRPARGRIARPTHGRCDRENRAAQQRAPGPQSQRVRCALAARRLSDVRRCRRRGAICSAR